MTDTAAAADEYPILFNSWSIRRILAGEKTQTRRIIKPQPEPGPGRGDYSRRWKGESWDLSALVGHLTEEECPYGQPGDSLWIRETFRLPEVYDEFSPNEYVETKRREMYYRFEADGRGFTTDDSLMQWDPEWGRKRPSIFMPYELCRLRPEVEDIRVQRIQEISSEDCIAEGIPSDTTEWDDVLPVDEIDLVHVDSERPARDGYPIEKDAFAALWDTIHGEGAWERNDWVRAVSFRLPEEIQ